MKNIPVCQVPPPFKRMFAFILPQILWKIHLVRFRPLVRESPVLPHVSGSFVNPYINVKFLLSFFL